MKAPRQHRVARSTLAVGMSAAVSLAYASPAGAATKPSGLTPGGQKIDLSLAPGDAPVLAPGMYQTTIPTDETERFIRVSRGEGERLEIGFAGAPMWKNGDWLADGATTGISLKITTPDGDFCDSSSESLSGSSNAPGYMTTSVHLDPKGTKRNYSDASDACLKAKELLVSFQRDNEGSQNTDMPAQLMILRTPAVSNPPATPTISDSDAPESAPFSGNETITPGGGFADATVVTNGGYTVKVTPGKPMFFRVYLHEGQRLSASWQVPKNGVSYTPEKDLRAQIQLNSPSLQDISGVTKDSESTTLSSISSASRSELVSAYTDAVNYSNGFLDSSTPHSATQWVTSPGWYYITTWILPTTSDANVTIKDIDTVLSVRVLGQAKQSPVSLKQPDAGAISGKGSAVNTTMIMAGLVGLGGLAATGAVGYTMYRRSRRA